jgi:hypothetical protein
MALMDSGIISLARLYKVIRESPDQRLLPKLAGKNAPGKSYTNACAEIANSFPKIQGLYLWGTFEKNKFWRNIYVGQAGTGSNASLRKRVLKELKDERAFAFRAFFSQSALEEIREEIHQGKYRSAWKRSVRKEGTTYIVWVSTPDIKEEKDLLRIEADLIESMNPSANADRDPPTEILGSKTLEIFRLFRTRINEQRETAILPVSLVKDHLTSAERAENP